MIESENQISHTASCPKSGCQCGALALQAITYTEYDALLEFFKSGELSAHEAVSLFFQVASRLAAALTHIRKLKQKTGEQNVIKLWTAVSAPAQEYASFLNGNKALYESDRDTRDKIINGDATINQMITFLKTAVPVAIDRLDSLDENWRSL
jgi:hypothetical protein